MGSRLNSEGIADARHSPRPAVSDSGYSCKSGETIAWHLGKVQGE
jgi:hypothetical protein